MVERHRPPPPEPVPLWPGWQELQAAGEQPAGPGTRLGLQQLHSPSLLTPFASLPKVFIGYETSRIENSAGMFGIQNHVAVTPLCFMPVSLTSLPWQTASKRARDIGKPGNPPLTHRLRNVTSRARALSSTRPPARGPGHRDTRAGKVPSQPRCPHELLVPQGQTKSISSGGSWLISSKPRNSCMFCQRQLQRRQQRCRATWGPKPRPAAGAAPQLLRGVRDTSVPTAAPAAIKAGSCEHTHTACHSDVPPHNTQEAQHA